MIVAEQIDRAGSAAAASAPDAGQRSRALLLPERTMYRDGRTPFTSVFTIKLAGKLNEERLRQALARVQARHPLLRCVVEDTGSGPRFVLQPKPAPIPLRMVERCGEDHWQIEARREWVTPFDGHREPLVRLVWIRGGESNELMLIGHHCICDGHTGMNLLRECLRAYDRPEESFGSYDSLGTIEDLVPATLLSDPRFQRRVRWKAALLRFALRIKRRKPATPCIAAEQMYFHRWHVDSMTTEAWTERCRMEGVTVLAAVSVAFTQAFRDVRGARALTKTRAMVNARRFMPQLPADAMFGLAPGVRLRMQGLPQPGVMAASSFWERARAVKADLALRIDRLGAGLYDYLVGLESLHDKYARMVEDIEAAPGVRHVTLSNMGRLDLPQQYQEFRLEAIYSPLVMVSPTPANTVVLSSFAGEMEFAIISDEQSLPRAQAAAIEQRAMEILRASVAASVAQTSDSSAKQSAVRANAG